MIKMNMEIKKLIFRIAMLSIAKLRLKLMAIISIIAFAMGFIMGRVI